MARAMLEYTKTILQKVSFDVLLFGKELNKASIRLLPNELVELEIWLRSFTLDKPELHSTLVVLRA